MYKYIVSIGLCCFLQPLMAQNNTIDLIAGKKVAQVSCVSCHGMDGNNIAHETPAVAGMNTKVLIKALLDYQTPKRTNHIMTPIARALSDTDIVNVSNFYARQVRALSYANPATVEEGGVMYRAGNLKKHIPACASCHGPTGAGNPSAVIPRLSFQSSSYIVKQLQLFQKSERTSDMYAAMRRVSARLSKEEMQAVASFCAGLH